MNLSQYSGSRRNARRFRGSFCRSNNSRHCKLKLPNAAKHASFRWKSIAVHLNPPSFQNGNESTATSANADRTVHSARSIPQNGSECVAPGGAAASGNTSVRSVLKYGNDAPPQRRMGLIMLTGREQVFAFFVRDFRLHDVLVRFKHA